MIKPGVATGDQVQEIFKLAKSKKFALPAVNVISSSSINGVLEISKELNSQYYQFSNGGSVFNAGKGLDAQSRSCHCWCYCRSKTCSNYVKSLRCSCYFAQITAQKLLPWLDGLIYESEKHYQENGYSFSSHMIDLSEEPLEENISICKKYLQKMSKIGMTLEIELGITGEEDGVDNTDIDDSKLYTQPDEVAYAYEELIKVG